MGQAQPGVAAAVSPGCTGCTGCRAFHRGAAPPAAAARKCSALQHTGAAAAPGASAAPTAPSVHVHGSIRTTTTRLPLSPASYLFKASPPRLKRSQTSGEGNRPPRLSKSNGSSGATTQACTASSCERASSSDCRPASSSRIVRWSNGASSTAGRVAYTTAWPSIARDHERFARAGRAVSAACLRRTSEGPSNLRQGRHSEVRHEPRSVWPRAASRG